MASFPRHFGRDRYGGALMILIGLGAAFEGIRYKIGTLSRMGPGFFPTVLGVLLALIGIALIAGAQPAVARAGKARAIIDWRGPLCIVLSLLVFVVLGKYGGLVPATFAVVFISALGDRQNTVRDASVLAIVLVLASIAIFRVALRMQFSLFQWG